MAGRDPPYEIWLNTHAPYDRALFGTGLFSFVFWIFINVHHYCLDAVTWRKGNPDVQRYLFAHLRPQRSAAATPTG